MELEKEWKHFAAMVLIGDGVMAVINPQHDAESWKHGPRLWQEAMQKMRKHPTLTRIVGLGQIVAGVSIALHEHRSKRPARLHDAGSEDAFVR